jgi:predicted deacetylase
MRNGPTYLIRFDDMCPTLNWPVWRDLEAIMAEAGVRPLLAVVPDNQDPKLRIAPADARFWDYVRTWQGRGWDIALHGYQHLYVTAEAGIIGLNRRSEFAGLPIGQQEEKLRRGLEIFRREGIHTHTWIAPAHSFDATTLTLLPQFGIHTISDGYSRHPYVTPDGLLWIPQQLWERFLPRPRGVWTVCIHIDDWTAQHVERFRKNIEQFGNQVASLGEVEGEYRERRRSWRDAVEEQWFGYKLRAKGRLKRWLTRAGLDWAFRRSSA